MWSNLQGKKAHMPHFLSELRIDGIRGLRNLRVFLDYPVTVLCGGNATGKSTVLLAAGCAYALPGSRAGDFAPSALLPRYRPRAGSHRDSDETATLDYLFLTPQGAVTMGWRRRGSWTRTHGGRVAARPPERPVYLRTRVDLMRPEEVRALRAMSRESDPPAEEALTPSQVGFAERLLPFRYSRVVSLSSGSRSLLFARRLDGPAYSELQMASGERAVLRLARDIAQVRGALVLIDEVEAGLHPWVQQLLMLHLQLLALRNDLQVIVTSHSPAIIDSVPRNARIFLDRDEHGWVTVREAFRDTVRHALYGQPGRTMKLLCEDRAAEALCAGVLDWLAFRGGIRRDAVRIGRDTGAGEFPAHAAAFRKFGQIGDFVFVLDGDQRTGEAADRIRQAAGRTVPVLFLPGDGAPEAWIWEVLREQGPEAGGLAVSREELDRTMRRLDGLYDTTAGTPSERVKEKLRSLARSLQTRPGAITRHIARTEADRAGSTIQAFIEGLEDCLANWRKEGNAGG